MNIMATYNHYWRVSEQHMQIYSSNNNLQPCWYSNQLAKWICSYSTHINMVSAVIFVLVINFSSLPLFFQASQQPVK